MTPGCGQALCSAVLATLAIAPASATILPRGTTALFNGGASSFDAFVTTVKSFNTAAPGQWRQTNYQLFSNFTDYI